MLRRTLTSGALAFVAIGLAVLTGSATAATPLPPNLQVQEASELRIEVKSDGTKLLRFTTTGWNSGTGALEIVAGDVDPGTSKQRVWQRIYDTAGGYQDYDAGFMNWHDDHNHVHFNDYALYTLRPAAANGTENRYGEKITFCLMDTDRLKARLDGAPKRAVYTSCGAARQGISVGWGDSYRYYLDGQWIDITNAPDGDYHLDIELDPKNRLMETNDADNSSSALIRIAGNSVTKLSGGGKPGNR